MQPTGGEGEIGPPHDGDLAPQAHPTPLQHHIDQLGLQQRARGRGPRAAVLGGKRVLVVHFDWLRFTGARADLNAEEKKAGVFLVAPGSSTDATDGGTCLVAGVTGVLSFSARLCKRSRSQRPEACLRRGHRGALMTRAVLDKVAVEVGREFGLNCYLGCRGGEAMFVSPSMVYSPSHFMRGDHGDHGIVSEVLVEDGPPGTEVPDGAGDLPKTAVLVPPVGQLRQHVRSLPVSSVVYALWGPNGEDAWPLVDRAVQRMQELVQHPSSHIHIEMASWVPFPTAAPDSDCEIVCNRQSVRVWEPFDSPKVCLLALAQGEATMDDLIQLGTVAAHANFNTIFRMKGAQAWKYMSSEAPCPWTGARVAYVPLASVLPDDVLAKTLKLRPGDVACIMWHRSLWQDMTKVNPLSVFGCFGPSSVPRVLVPPSLPPPLPFSGTTTTMTTLLRAYERKRAVDFIEDE